MMMAYSWMNRVRYGLLGLCAWLCAAAWGQQRHGDGLDDVAQYLPMATLLALKASGADNGKGWGETLTAAGMSYAVTAVMVAGLKYGVKEWRPDGSDRRSFPSGHAVLAFAGATALYKEYGHLSPWVSVGGYGVALVTAVDRVLRDRHHWYDVLAGAAIGTGGTFLSYRVTRKIFPGQRMDVALAANGLRMAVCW